ncbi:MAG: ABC transporter permease subunit [Verrucomicrobiota bacterium]
MNKILAIAHLVSKELYRRKDVYVLFVLTAVLTLLLASMSFFNDASAARYIKELCLALIWLSTLVVGIMTAARQLPAEREQRTICPLLAKPVTRGQVIVGKFLGCWLSTGVALVVFYGFFMVVAGTREHAWPLSSYLQAIWLHWAMLGMVIALTMVGSVTFSAPSSNTTIVLIVALAILGIGRHLNKVAVGLPEPASSIVYFLYFCIPHLEFFDLRDFIIHDWGATSWAACTLAVVYALSYMGLFLTAAWFIFRRKPLT